MAAPPRGNLLVHLRLTLGAEDEPARDVLWRALQAIEPALSWQMLCEVGERAMCAVNIYPLPRE